MSEQQLIDDVMPATEENGALLDEIIDSTQAIRSESDRGRVKSQLSSFLNEVLAGTVLLSSDLISSIESRMAEIDALLSAQISKIIHMPAFQATEASWRGLHTLVHKSVTENTRIRVFNCTKKELLKDFKSASDFDQSTLFKTIYESEYGTFGGAPFSALVGDFEFDSMPQDIELLEQISHVAAAAHAPFLSAANAGMFGLSGFNEITRPRDLNKLFDTSDYIRWKSFRDQEDARYIGLTLPRVVGRLPYGANTLPVETFNFEEEIEESTDGRGYLWINAAYELAGRLVSSFEESGWCAAIRGVEGGGLVNSLPIHNYISSSGEKLSQCPTGVAPAKTDTVNL